jgi:hypothetical protein
MKSKAVKRAEAEERAQHVEHNRTKAHRLDRCDGSCGIKTKVNRKRPRRKKSINKEV